MLRGVDRCRIRGRANWSWEREGDARDRKSGGEGREDVDRKGKAGWGKERNKKR